LMVDSFRRRFWEVAGRGDPHIDPPWQQRAAVNAWGSM